MANSQTTIHSASFELDSDSWTDGAGNDFNWTRDSGGTPSGSTGPSTGAAGSYYMYVESSSPNYPNKTANLVSPSFNLTGTTSSNFAFSYHMYGIDMGTLAVDISTNGGTSFTNNIWSQSGQVQTGNGASWTTVNLDLSAYVGQTINIRFRGTTNNGYRGDMAIDNISLTVTYASGPEIEVLGNGISITDGNTSPTATDNTDFQNVLISTYIEKTFTISNIGTSTLNLSGSPIVSISGSSFFTVVVQPSSSTIASGGSNLTFTVRFNPTALGTVQAIISIANNDSNENPFNFTIQGTGSSASAFIGPGGVNSDLGLWLKANDGLSYSDGESVLTWTDNGTGSNAVVNLTSQAPKFNDNATRNINFNPIVDFSNTPNAPYETNYNYTPQQYLQGSSGFYTQDIFVVAIPNSTVSSSFGAMDMFCGDADTSQNTDKDVTGIGWGNYSVRYSNEMLAFAISSTADAASTPVNSRGYGVAHVSTTDTYDNVGIINAKNNADTSPNGQLLNYNGRNVGNTEVGVPQFVNVSNSKYWIGRSQSYRGSFDGRICEIITYSSKKDDANARVKIQSYLAIKYGITLHTGSNSRLADVNYLDSNSSVIWDVTANNGFNYDIAGIGQDNQSELNQKQSKSVNSGSLVAIGLGEVALTNNLNPNNFKTDRDFLVWGNNNGNFNTSSEVSRSVNLSGSTTTFTPVSRKWKIIESQNDVPEVVISIPTASLTSNIALAANEEYMLVVSNDSNFAAANIIDVVPLTVNGSNSEVWYDFDNTKYFTIAKATRVVEKRRLDFNTGEFIIGDKNLELSSDFTVSAWILNNGNGGSFISKGTGYNLKVNSSNYIEVAWNGPNQFTSNNAIPDSKWHHVALTFSAGSANLYIDGVLDKTVNALSNPTVSNYRFTIGALYLDKANITSFDGAVDEVRLWNTSLSVTEIRYIMNQEIENFSTVVNGKIIPNSISKNDISSKSWSNLKAYYDMNSFYGTTVEDNSDNKNWARIKYLTIDKQIVETQTAPLPYESSSNGNWDTPATWLNNAVQYLPNSSVFGTPVDWNIVETNNIINATRGVTVLGLLNNANELSINADNHLTISHYLKLNGVIDLDGESQLVQTTGSDLDNASTGYIERDQQGTGNKYRYNVWSSPVIKTGFSAGTTFTIADILQDGTNAAAPGAIVYNNSTYDGATSPMTLSTYWMYKFADSPDGDYSAWEQIRSTGNLVEGEGFIMKGTGEPGSSDQNYVFVGKPNNGDVTLTVSGGNDYLVGNPYASAIDCKKFILDNSPAGTGSITGAIYYWEHYGGDTHNLLGYQAGYGTYSLGGGIKASAHPNVSSGGTAIKTPGQYIPVAQGFFVQGDADGGEIIFKNSQRVFETEAGGSSVFMKGVSGKTTATSKVEADTRPKFRIGFDAPKIDHRQLLLTIDELGSDGYDWGYDAEIYQIFEDDMYWLIENKKYVIQVTNVVEVNKEIPVGVITTAGGEISIMVDEIEYNEDDLAVYLKDNDTNEEFDITNAAYKVDLPAGEYHDKYSITFKPNTSLSVENEVLNTNFLIYFNKNDKSIVINNNELLKINGISLYNILGQNIDSFEVNSSVKQSNLSVNVSAGLYILKVDTEDGYFTKKMVLN